MHKVRRTVIIIATVLLFNGCFLLVFPVISNIIGVQIANIQITQFDNEISNIFPGSFEDALANGEIDNQGYHIDSNGNRTDGVQILYEIDIQRLYEDSIKYNENLQINQYSLLTNSLSYTKPALNLDEYGIFNKMYGYISAPTINMNLPIYLGADNVSMSCGAAHLTCTSLPIGGDSTNCVIAGHTGYIGRIFFDNIINLQIGDTVTVTNYWDKLNYKVINANVCNPTDVKDIYVVKGKDLLTLITCINGGSDRYIVICERC